jgi:hypothetical protein
MAALSGVGSGVATLVVVLLFCGAAQPNCKISRSAIAANKTTTDRYLLIAS